MTTDKPNLELLKEWELIEIITDQTEKIEKIEPAIQPIITVFLGLMVCWIILSVMAPIYDIMLTIG